MDKLPSVLIIEDDRDTRDFLSFALSSDFEIRAVSSRNEALNLLESNYQPQCVLMDVAMAGMTVEEFVVRSRIQHHVVLMTAHGDAHEFATRYGFKRVLIKPFSPAELVKIIRIAIASGEHPAVP